MASSGARARAGVDVICQMDADLSHDPCASAGADRRHRACRHRDRLALRAGRRDRQLAAPAPDAEPVREYLHPPGHAAEARATAPAATAAGGARRSPRCRSIAFHLGRLFVPRRDAVRGRRRAAARSRKCRSPSSSAGWANRSCPEAVLLESAITPWRLIGARRPAVAPREPLFRAMV